MGGQSFWEDTIAHIDLVGIVVTSVATGAAASRAALGMPRSG